MRISVVIPAYNRAKLLPHTLRSLLNQTLAADEIIVVDDGSSDDTAKVAEGFGDPVRVIRQNNAGPSAARNHGFRESTGDIIHFFDSDDLALPNKHQTQWDCLQSSGADIALGPWVKGRFSERRFLPDNQVYQQNGLPSGSLVKALLSNWSIVPQSCMFRREIVQAAGGFPEDLRCGEDQIFFLNCLLKQAKVAHTPETLTLYRNDNQDEKLSGTGTGQLRSIQQWGRTLLRARSLCQSHQVDPCQWTGFRRRCQQAANDLKDYDPELSGQLTRCVQQHERPIWDRTSVVTDRLWYGAQWRLQGRRGHRYFRMGPLTSRQKQLMEPMEW